MKIIKLSVMSLILVNLSFNVIAQEVEGATGYCNNQRTDCNTAGEDGMPTEVENGSPGSGQPGGSQSEGPGGDNSSGGESPAERATRKANEKAKEKRECHLKMELNNNSCVADVQKFAGVMTGMAYFCGPWAVACGVGVVIAVADAAQYCADNFSKAKYYCESL